MRVPSGATAPPRRDQREIVAGPYRKLLGQPDADGNPLPFVEVIERAARLDVVRDRGKFRQVADANAADEHAGGIERRRGERLTLDDRRGKPHARHLGDPVGDRLPIGERRFERLDQKVAVEAEYLFQQLLAEPVHHRHHDDQRCNAEHDAEKGEPGDDRDESLFAPRTQVAQRQHPLERGEGMSAGRLSHSYLVPARPPSFT
jgi:hypothetical protein